MSESGFVGWHAPMHEKTVSISGEIETVGLFEGDEELSGSFEGRGTGALPDMLRTSGRDFGSAGSEKSSIFFERDF
jgi:hypothetical protein